MFQCFLYFVQVPTLYILVGSNWNRSQVPSYEEIVGGDSEDSGEGEGQVGVSEDEDSLERQENFERKFNFRFEEPGGNQVYYNTKFSTYNSKELK